MIVAVDFDGTVVEHMFPEIGNEVPEAFKWLKKWQDAGVDLILWTMRSDGPESEEKYLQKAIDFCKDREITFTAVNTGIRDREWTSSQKAYANVYIDDTAFGCPLVESKRMGGRPYVDWDIVGPGVSKLLGIA